MREAESGRAIQIYSAGKFDSNLFMEVARFSRILERAMGIEPTSEAWEASILPLYDARSGFLLPLF